MKTKFVLTAIITGLLTVSSLIAQETKPVETKNNQIDKKHLDNEHEQMSQVTYSCAMKCEGEKAYKKAGNCPKCSMNLTKMEMSNDKIAKSYTCSMHPEVESDQAGKCSKCGMNLIEKKVEHKMEHDHKGHKH